MLTEALHLGHTNKTDEFSMLFIRVSIRALIHLGIVKVHTGEDHCWICRESRNKDKKFKAAVQSEGSSRNPLFFPVFPCLMELKGLVKGLSGLPRN
jgi:hypothetical protein